MPPRERLPALTSAGSGAAYPTDGGHDGPRDAAGRATCRERLATGTLEIVGRITDASNLALLVAVHAVASPEEPAPEAAGADPGYAIYKPVRGERPLWDFPSGTLAGREVASALLAEALGYALVPPTVLREGPMGAGSVQLWIGDPFLESTLTSPVRLAPVGSVGPGWLAVVDGELPDGSAVTIVHEDAHDVRDAAVLDAVLNNSDRKGSHLVRDGAGTLWGFDHGLTLHSDPKLRTVLWGWAGQPLRERDIDALTDLTGRLAAAADPLTAALAQLLPRADVDALRARVERLLARGIHPLPGRGWPAIPWPAL